MSVIWFHERTQVNIGILSPGKDHIKGGKKPNNPNDNDLLNKKGHISKVQNLLYEYEITLKAWVYVNVLIID